MSAKKPIVVRIDGKKTKNHASKNNSLEEEKRATREQAAAAEESSDNRIHTFAREYDPSLMLSKSHATKNGNLNIFKPILIAIISAIIIGSIMGFVMLKIIVNFDNDLNNNPTVATADADKDASEKNGIANGSEGSLYKIDTTSAFVLQGGVFSEKANAETESTKFIEAGYDPVIWERDSQFYLLVGIGNTKEDVLQVGESLQSSGIEVYAKEWQVAETEVTLTEEEHNWIHSFQEKWNASLEDGSSEQILSDWKQFLKTAPDQSNAFNTFVKSLEDNVNNLSGESKHEVRYTLLTFWNQYASFINNSVKDTE
ncbi:hypothetical protein [Ornithinibacillus xuwenensis]|uniref:SPOR domain-containing protein n=1 Tax=Ornithinibacillus xuwenensis TaxID=3144668 RepID=A0ABU9XBU1_9BACI